MSDFKEILGVLFIAFCSVLIVILGLITAVYLLNSYDCKEYPRVETKMAGMSCYTLDEDNRWVLLSSYVRVVKLNVVK